MKKLAFILLICVAVFGLVGLYSYTSLFSPVSGVVKSVDVKHSVPTVLTHEGYSALPEVKFVAITIVATRGTLYYVALPEEFIGVHEISSGDEITVRLGRTAFRTTVGEHLIREKDGTMQVRGPT